MSINKRIAEIIKAKTGTQREFAKIFNSTPQYVLKLVTEGGSVGLEPVTKILEAYPDIDARWLITGEGEMISSVAYADLRTSVFRNVAMMLDLEKFIPYMTVEERGIYSEALGKSEQSLSYPDDRLSAWKKIHKERALNAK